MERHSQSTEPGAGARRSGQPQRRSRSSMSMSASVAHASAVKHYGENPVRSKLTLAKMKARAELARSSTPGGTARPGQSNKRNHTVCDVKVDDAGNAPLDIGAPRLIEETVVTLEATLANSTGSFRRFFRQAMHRSAPILEDAFWFVFCELFQRDGRGGADAAKKALYRRLSLRYTKWFTSMPAGRERDFTSQYFPYAMIHSCVNCYRLLFPASGNMYNGDFIDRVTALIFKLFVSTKGTMHSRSLRDALMAAVFTAPHGAGPIPPPCPQLTPAPRLAKDWADIVSDRHGQYHVVGYRGHSSHAHKRKKDVPGVPGAGSGGGGGGAGSKGLKGLPFSKKGAKRQDRLGSAESVKPGGKIAVFPSYLNNKHAWHGDRPGTAEATRAAVKIQAVARGKLSRRGFVARGSALFSGAMQSEEQLHAQYVADEIEEFGVQHMISSHDGRGHRGQYNHSDEARVVTRWGDEGQLANVDAQTAGVEGQSFGSISRIGGGAGWSAQEEVAAAEYAMVHGDRPRRGGGASSSLDRSTHHDIAAGGRPAGAHHVARLDKSFEATAHRMRDHLQALGIDHGFLDEGSPPRPVDPFAPKGSKHGSSGHSKPGSQNSAATAHSKKGAVVWQIPRGHGDGLDPKTRPKTPLFKQSNFESMCPAMRDFFADDWSLVAPPSLENNKVLLPPPRFGFPDVKESTVKLYVPSWVEAEQAMAAEDDAGGVPLDAAQVEVVEQKLHEREDEEQAAEKLAAMPAAMRQGLMRGLHQMEAPQHSREETRDERMARMRKQREDASVQTAKRLAAALRLGGDTIDAVGGGTRAERGYVDWKREHKSSVRHDKNVLTKQHKHLKVQLPKMLDAHHHRHGTTAGRHALKAFIRKEIVEAGSHHPVGFSTLSHLPELKAPHRREELPSFGTVHISASTGRALADGDGDGIPDDEQLAPIVDRVTHVRRLEAKLAALGDTLQRKGGASAAGLDESGRVADIDTPRKQRLNGVTGKATLQLSRRQYYREQKRRNRRQELSEMGVAYDKEDATHDGEVTFTVLKPGRVPGAELQFHDGATGAAAGLNRSIVESSFKLASTSHEAISPVKGAAKPLFTMDEEEGRVRFEPEEFDELYDGVMAGKYVLPTEDIQKPRIFMQATSW